MRIQRITRPVSPSAQYKTPGSRTFATVGFKLRGQDSNYPRKTRGKRPRLLKAAQNPAHFAKISPPADPDLIAVIECWPDLPEAVKAGILAMVRAADGTK